MRGRAGRTCKGESTMDPKIEDFMMALNDFATAARNLAGQWELASDAVGDHAAVGYPFPNSFDEVAYGIRLWAEVARKAYLPTLMREATMPAKIVSCRIGHIRDRCRKVSRARCRALP